MKRYKTYPVVVFDDSAINHLWVYILTTKLASWWSDLLHVYSNSDFHYYLCDLAIAFITDSITTISQYINSLRPRQNGYKFPDDIFKCVFLNENVQISIKSSLKFVPNGLINNIPALVQIMAWHRPGDKSLSEPMMVRLLTHICVTRPW